MSSSLTRQALLVAAVFFGTQSTHALASNTADALFFARFGVENLPVMYVVLGLLTMAALIGYGVALGSLPRVVLYPGLLAVVGLSLVVVRLLIELDQRWVYAVVWLVASLGVLVTLTFMWSLASDSADARSAKRLFPIFASAGILGGVLGNLATGPLTAALGAPNVLLVAAAILCVTAVAAVGASAPLSSAQRGGRKTPSEGMRAALVLAWHDPLLRLVAVAFFVGSALFYSVAFPFSTQVAESFDTEAEIASYLGVFAAAATAVTFVVSLFLVNRVFSRIGVVLAWFLVGLVYVAGFSLWLVSLTLVTASVFRFAQWVTTASIGSTARSAMFNVLRPERRAKVMAAFAAVPAQLGVVLAGGLLWVGSRLGERVNSSIGLVLALILAGAIWRMRRRYPEALVEALREGEVDAFVGANTGVAQLEAPGEGIAVALEGLGDNDAHVRRLAVEMLGRLDAVDAYGNISALLQDPDVDVRLAALQAMDAIAANRPDSAVVQVASRAALGTLAPEGQLAADLVAAPAASRAGAAAWLARVGEHELAGDLMSGLIGSGDPAERLAATRAIVGARWEPEQGAAVRLLQDDPSQAVRAGAAAAVAAVDGPSVPLRTALLDASPLVRIAAAEAWARVAGPPTAGVELLKTQPAWAWEAATIALGDRAGEVRDDVIDWTAGQLEALAEVTAQSQVIAQATADGMPATDYLSYLMSEWVGSARRVAVRVLGLLEDEQTVRLVLAGIGSADVEARAQALEATESFGGALGHRVVPLLEGGPGRLPPMRDVVDTLVRQDDPYVRALALRSIMELAAREWARVVRPLVDDPDPMVNAMAQDVSGRMEVEMGETLDTMGRMDRMLLLRRVSIFRELLPEDLDRLAELATESVYEDGDIMLARGDMGGDLLVIVDGEVDIGPAGGNAIQRLGPGEHIGELTALSGRARPTDAVAVGPVRALAISGAAFGSLILDRPEVARLMLAAIAVRLSDALGNNVALP